jgi:hypothetical protein
LRWQQSTRGWHVNGNHQSPRRSDRAPTTIPAPTLSSSSLGVASSTTSPRGVTTGQAIAAYLRASHRYARQTASSLLLYCTVRPIVDRSSVTTHQPRRHAPRRRRPACSRLRGAPPLGEHTPCEGPPPPPPPRSRIRDHPTRRRASEGRRAASSTRRSDCRTVMRLVWCARILFPRMQGAPRFLSPRRKLQARRRDASAAAAWPGRPGPEIRIPLLTQRLICASLPVGALNSSEVREERMYSSHSSVYDE